jgi:hypothetical protein
MGRRRRAAEGWLTVSEFVELVGIHGQGKNAVDNARALLAEFAFEGEDAAIEVERDGRPLTELGFRAVPTGRPADGHRPGLGGLVEIRIRDRARFDEVVERMHAAATFTELEKRAGGAFLRSLSLKADLAQAKATKAAGFTELEKRAPAKPAT